MKKNVLVLTISLFALTMIFEHTIAQSSDWIWAKGMSGTGLDEGWSNCTDANGNVYITGFFISPTLTFDSIVLTNVGIYDIFLAKYDSIGNVIWAKSAGGSADDFSYSVCVDHSGNVFITGFFQSPTISFGSTILTNYGGGNPDIFLAKYDSDGNVLWAKSAGGTGQDVAKSISADDSGNVYVTGNFMSPTITFGSYTLTNYGYLDAFLVKYDASGNVVWATNPHCTFYDEGFSVVTDALGNIFVTGYFQNAPIIFGSYTLTNAGNTDIFIVKYNSSGNVLWAKSVGGTDSDGGNSLCTDALGNLYMTGYFQSSSITFDGFTLTNSSGNHDIFVVKYNTTGNVQWAHSSGGSGPDDGYSICTDTIGNVFVTGGFYSPSITFGSITLTRPSGSVDPMFIIKYNSAGKEICATALASGGDDNSGISPDNLGNAYIVDDFYTSPFIIGADTLLLGAPNAENIFVAKYHCDNSSSINEINDKESISVFPNPFTVQTTLQSDKIFENATLTLYNSLGQQVKKITNISGQTKTLNRENLPSGLYFMRLTQNNKCIATDKLIIKDK